MARHCLATPMLVLYIYSILPGVHPSLCPVKILVTELFSTDTPRQSAQLRNTQKPEYRTTATLRENRAVTPTLVRPCVQNVPGKIGEARPADYSHGEATQRSSKDQVE